MTTEILQITAPKQAWQALLDSVRFKTYYEIGHAPKEANALLEEIKRSLK